MWTGSTQVPPNGNTPTPIHIGAVDQVKSAGLALNSLAVFGNGWFQGSIRVGNTVNTEAGAIRWTSSDFEGYTGTEWKWLTASSVTTQAGLPFYGTGSESKSTARKKQCQAVGGTIADYQSNSFCKISASSCPSGWTRYQNLGSASATTCTGASNNCSGTSCTTGNHNFANMVQEKCNYTNGYHGSRMGQGKLQGCY